MTSLDTQAAPGAVRNRTITWNDPVAARAQGRALDGYERLVAMQRGELSPPPAAAMLGCRSTR